MTELELPPDVQAAFYNTVWNIVRQIPPGKVASYGQIAGYIPSPPGVPPEQYPAYRARWVGQAMSASPSGVPWQRVINAQGKISFRSSAAEQRRLLEAEGITFDDRERVDMKRYAWEGPDNDWLRQNNLIYDEGPQQASLF